LWRAVTTFGLRHRAERAAREHHPHVVRLRTPAAFGAWLG